MSQTINPLTWKFDETGLSSGAISSIAWSLTGNTGTNPTTNFIGTTDSQPLRFVVDNVEVGQILTTQQVVFGATTAYNANTLLSVYTVTNKTAAYFKGGNAGTPAVVIDDVGNNGGLSINAAGVNYGRIFSSGSLFIDGVQNAPMYIRSTQDIVFRAGGLGTSNLMTLKASGNVLIGTTTDAGYKLDVNGVGRFGTTGIISSPNSSTVYVGSNVNASYASTSNTIIGANAGTLLTTSGMRNNVFIGDYAGQLASGDSVFNTFIGSNAGKNTTGRENTFIGFNVGSLNTSGAGNTAIGSGALNSSVTGYYNTAVGQNALQNNTGNFGTAFGQSAGSGNTTGSDNVYFGVLSGNSNTTGSENTYIGSRVAQSSNVTGGSNTFLGYNAGANGISTSRNTFLGNRSGVGTGTGSNDNIAIGYRSMVTAGHTGSNNVVIGNNLDAPSLTGSNQTNINGTFVASSSFAWIGGNRSVGIGTTTDVASSILTLESTTKGFLPTRMTNAQRTAIASPAVGLIVYCTDTTEGLYIYKSTGWTFII